MGKIKYSLVYLVIEFEKNKQLHISALLRGLSQLVPDLFDLGLQLLPPGTQVYCLGDDVLGPVLSFIAVQPHRHLIQVLYFGLIEPLGLEVLQFGNVKFGNKT